MPLRPCGQPGCKELVAKGRCAAHARARAASQDASHRWVYRDQRWFAARRRALVRAEHRCQAVGCLAIEGLHAHHDYPGGVLQMLRDGVDPFDERRIVILCETHHGQLEQYLRSRRKAGNSPIRR